jgi:hypothetical protein
MFSALKPVLLASIFAGLATVSSSVWAFDCPLGYTEVVINEPLGISICIPPLCLPSLCPT